MVNFNMIDTVGRGIRKIYTEQRNRFFPMPDYDIDNEHRTVGVTIYGKMIDEKYTELLKHDTSLTLKECIWLDAVQKHRPLTKEATKYLQDRELVEGKYPNLTISSCFPTKGVILVACPCRSIHLIFLISSSMSGEEANML